MDPFPWTDRLLRIPVALAHKYGRGDPQLIEELESFGNLALVKAASRYEPDHGTQPGTWLYNNVSLEMRRYLDDRQPHSESRWRRLNATSLDALPGQEADGRLLDLIGDEDDPTQRPERQELAGGLLRRLRPLDRAVVILVEAQGLTLREAGARLNLSAEAVRVRHQKAMERLRRSRVGTEKYQATPQWVWERGQAALASQPMKAIRRRMAKKQRMANQGRRDWARARLAMGAINLADWYFADHPNRRVLGPAETLTRLYEAAGIMAPRDTSLRGTDAWVATRLGWPGLRPLAAKCLDRMVMQGGAHTTLDLAAAFEADRKSVQRAINALRRRGWLEGGRFGPYRATERATVERGVVCTWEPIRGWDAKALADEGYDVLPVAAVVKQSA